MKMIRQCGYFIKFPGFPTKKRFQKIKIKKLDKFKMSENLFIL